MTERLRFWAQALDNTSPDHFDMRGEPLAPDDSAARQEIVSRVSRVARSGSRVFQRDGVRLLADGRHFVVEVASVQRDEAGRIAPVVCYGSCSRNDTLPVDETVVAIVEFAAGIGRSVHPEHVELIHAALSAQQKKVRRGRLGGLVDFIKSLVHGLRAPDRTPKTTVAAAKTLPEVGDLRRTTKQ